MEKLFLSVLNLSLTAGYVILFIMLVRLPLKKAPKLISYALWSIAAFRLLCPFSFESMFSLLPVKAVQTPQDIVYRQGPQTEGGITIAQTYVSQVLPSSTVSASVDPTQIYTRAGMYIWLLGIAVMLIYSIVSVLILKNRLKSARHTERNIYEADNLKSPFVLGIFRPKIFIPAGLTAEETSHIIRHEQTHIRRLDHIIKPFAFLVLSIHWFNPLVWVAFVLMSTDMELSCDERVIKEMGGEIKKAYSASLLSLASGKRILNGSPLAFGEGNVKGRIKNVLNYKKSASWIITVVVIAVIAVGIGLISNPHSNAPSMEWAKSLSVENVRNIELIVQTSLEHERYKKYEPGEFTEIVELINQSRGKLVKNPEDNNGSAQTFYITTKDGIVHRFSNIGNTYLKIDGDAYEAGYDWLSMWNFHGNSAVPAEFREKVVAGSSTAKTGGGQGLTPYASQRTSLEPIAPRWSPEQSIDIVGMAELDYASDDIVIFHGYFGLFVYDLDSLQIIRSLDLKPLKCAAIQGDDYCDVTVSTDGNTVQLHRMSSENMYVYTVSDNTLRETAYERMNDRFGSNFVPIEGVIDSKKLGNYSYNAVKFDTGEYGYLHISDWTLGTLSYVRDDMRYKLFDIKEN